MFFKYKKKSCSLREQDIRMLSVYIPYENLFLEILITKIFMKSQGIKIIGYSNNLYIYYYFL